jgi:hypothetical protein
MTSARALSALKNEKQNSKLELFVLHVGLRDLREGRSLCEVQDDIGSCLSRALGLYPNAKIACSELLHMRKNDQLNLIIDETNCYLKVLCRSHPRMLFVDHPDL